MRKPLIVTLSVVCTLKGVGTCWVSQYKGSKLCIVCCVCHVSLSTLLTQRSKYAMHWMLCIQSNEVWKLYSTMYLEIWKAVYAIYVDTVDTKHIHTFLPITFLIFNQFSIRKKFWKAETGLFNHTINTKYVDTVDTRQGSLMHSMLSMLTLSIQNMKVCNVFSAIYVDTVNTKH